MKDKKKEKVLPKSEVLEEPKEEVKQPEPQVPPNVIILDEIKQV